ncbi:hypothetical protein [Gloeobacter kilaueensis]|nr:hypothetical protein [Gloeobacter kilaueensis]
MEEEPERYQTEDVIVTCPFCQATSSGDLHETVALLAACEHCRLDIAEDGEHSGFGDAVLSGLSRRFGSKETWAAWRQATA